MLFSRYKDVVVTALEFQTNEPIQIREILPIIGLSFKRQFWDVAECSNIEGGNNHNNSGLILMVKMILSIA